MKSRKRGVTDKNKLSVIINTFNESKNLERAVRSVSQLADEIVVCDMESTDATVTLAKSLGAKIFSYKQVGYVEPARNFAIQKASNEWVLVLDADEELTKTARENLLTILKNPSADFYRLPRKNIIFGKWIKYARWWPDFNIRLFRKDHVVWNEVIHTVPMTKGVGSDIEASEELALTHHNYETIEDYLQKLNRYTTLHSEILVKEGYKFDWKHLLTKPAEEFFSRYFMGKGYKDGLHGLVLSGLQAFSEFVLYLKLWQKNKFFDTNIEVKEVVGLMRKTEKDLHYWQNDANFSESRHLVYRIKRKLRI